MTFIHDPQLCRQCRGLCCQGHPGVWIDPRRFRRSFFPTDHAVPSTTDLAYLGLEWRDLGGVAVPAPRSAPWGCVFLGSSGCTLPPRLRPGQCLALIPHLDTLLSGEIHCRLPAAAGMAAARRRWQRFWRRRARFHSSVAEPSPATSQAGCDNPTSPR